MSKAESQVDAKAVVQQFHEAAFDRLDPTAVDRLCAPHYVLHDPAFPGGAGRDLTKRLITTLRTGVPDVTHAWEDRMVVGDTVITRWSATGTHTGSLFGNMPRQPGKQVTMTGMYIDRVENGKIAETWSEWDQLSMLRQIGVESLAEAESRELGR